MQTVIKKYLSRLSISIIFVLSLLGLFIIKQKEEQHIRILRLNNITTDEYKAFTSLFYFTNKALIKKDIDNYIVPSACEAVRLLINSELKNSVSEIEGVVDATPFLLYSDNVLKNLKEGECIIVDLYTFGEKKSSYQKALAVAIIIFIVLVTVFINRK